MAFELKINGLDATVKKVDAMATEVKSKGNEALTGFANQVVRSAKDNLQRSGTSNTGALAGSINADTSTNLSVSITVAKNYAAYIEFGTRKYAAQYVATLPADWKQYAATFKGKGTGTFEQMIDSLMQWVHDRGLDSNTAKTGTYSIKTRKRTGNALRQGIEDRQTAYVIARWILINGIRPRPYLYPAVQQHIGQLKTDIKNIFK